MLQVRSKLEQSAAVWHSSLTKKNTSDLERVQKCALRVILGEKYLNYKNALEMVKLDSLGKRREKLCLKFAKQCLRNEKLKSMFPRKINNHLMEKRKDQKFDVRNALTERYRRSSIPSMQRLLNKAEKERSEMMKKIESTVPVNYDAYLYSYH